MGFLSGSFCSLHHSFFTSSNSQCSIQPPFLLSSSKIAPTRMKNRVAMACLQRKFPKDCDYCARRVVIFMGFAVVPLLNMRAEAIEALNAENNVLGAEVQKQDAEQSVEGRSPQNPFFPLLNALGLLGSGVLAALCASILREKATSDATVESMNTKLKEKESSITSLEKKYAVELSTEKENQNEALEKVNEEQLSLVTQLKLENDTIKGLGQELQKVKKIVENLNLQIDNLEASLDESENEKWDLKEHLNKNLDSLSVLQERISSFYLEIQDKDDDVRVLDTTLADKEREVNKISDLYQKSLDEITRMNSEIERLRDLIRKNEEELELRGETINSLDKELKSLLAEKDECVNEYDLIVKEYNHLKSATDMKSVSVAKILGEKEEKIHQLEEQLEDSLDEVNKNKGLVSDLVWEKEKLKEKLDIEFRNGKILEEEIEITLGDLENSRNEASDLGEKLLTSRKSCVELEAEVSKTRSEYNETRNSLQMNIDETKKDNQVVIGEIKSAKEKLGEKTNELQIKSEELSAALRKCDILEKELIDTRTKAENAALDLKEEKFVTSCLNRELNILETQISRYGETRRELESDLDEACESLNEMGQHVFTLSREIEIANGKISSLEDEREAILKAFDLQKQACQEAHENLEDGHDLVTRLGKERESLRERGKKLEQELASAKGEILRLKSEITSFKSQVSERPTRKVGRRRKADAQQED